jgi:hypothetical protein
MFQEILPIYSIITFHEEPPSAQTHCSQDNRGIIFPNTVCGVIFTKADIWHYRQRLIVSYRLPIELGMNQRDDTEEAKSAESLLAKSITSCEIWI